MPEVSITKPPFYPEDNLVEITGSIPKILYPGTCIMIFPFVCFGNYSVPHSNENAMRLVYGFEVGNYFI